LNCVNWNLIEDVRIDRILQPLSMLDYVRDEFWIGTSVAGFGARMELRSFRNF
jgi:hypothetical protein